MNGTPLVSIILEQSISPRVCYQNSDQHSTFGRHIAVIKIVIATTLFTAFLPPRYSPAFPLRKPHPALAHQSPAPTNTPIIPSTSRHSNRSDDDKRRLEGEELDGRHRSMCGQLPRSRGPPAPVSVTKNGTDMAGGVRGGYVAMPCSWFPLSPLCPYGRWWQHGRLTGYVCNRALWQGSYIA